MVANKNILLNGRLEIVVPVITNRNKKNLLVTMNKHLILPYTSLLISHNYDAMENKLQTRIKNKDLLFSYTGVYKAAPISVFFLQHACTPAHGRNVM